MVVSLLLIGVQGSRADLHIPATSVDQALLKASAAFGSPMVAGVSVQDKIVVIEARQVTESDFREQMAKVLNATWERKDNRWFLTKGDAQRREEQQRQYAFRLDSLQKLIDARAKAPETNAKLDKNQQTSIQARLQSEATNPSAGGKASFFQYPSKSAYGLPNQRFLTNVLKKVGAERLAEVAPGRRVVFALRPNAVQSPLGINIDSELRSGSDEQSLWLQSGRKETEKLVVGGSTVSVAVSNGTRFIYEPSYFSSSQPWPTQVQNVLLGVYCDIDGTYNLSVKVIPQANNEQSFSASATTFENTAASSQSPALPATANTFELSESATAFHDWLAPLPGKTIPSLPMGTIDEFADVVKNDPLSYGLSESLAFIAKQEGRNLIACVEDQDFRVRTPKALASWFTPEDSRWARITKSDNWLLVRPSLFGESNLPRKSLQTILRHTRNIQRVDLDSQAVIAGQRPRNTFPSPMLGFIERFLNGRSYLERASDDALKCKAYISPQEFTQAMTPQGITFGQLRPKLQNHLVGCVYHNPTSNLQIIKQNGIVPFYAYSEPTLMAPEGILPQAPFRITATAETLIQDEGGKTGGRLGTGSAESFGRMKYFAEHPRDGKSSVQWESNRRVSLLELVTYTFTLTVNNSCFWSGQVTQLNSRDKQTYTLDTLPQDLREKIDSGYRQGPVMYEKMNVTGVSVTPKKQQNIPPVLRQF